MSDIAIVYLILATAVVLFVSGRVPVGLVAIGVALALWATGILSLETALSGFGDPTVLFIASLFVVSEGLDATGVTAWAGQQLIDRGGTARNRLVLFTMLLVAALTAVISVNGAVAALLPVVVVIAVRTGLPPSQLLMPLVFGAHAGSMLTLTGTPVNVIVSNYADELTGQAVRLLRVRARRHPAARRVDPGDAGARAAAAARPPPEVDARGPQPPRPHARRAVRAGRRRRRAGGRRPDPGSSAGCAPSSIPGPGRTSPSWAWRPQTARASRSSARSRPATGCSCAARWTASWRRPRTSASRSFPRRTSTSPRASSAARRAWRRSSSRRARRSSAKPVFPGMVTESGSLVVLAIQRQGEDQGPREVRLQVGDTLLLQGTWDAIEEHAGDRSVLAVDSPELVRRQAVPLGPGAGRAIAILVAMILALATGVVPSAVAGLVAAGALVLTRVLTPEARLPRDLVDDRRARGRDDPAVDGDDGDGRGRRHRRCARRRGAASLGPYALLAGLFLVTAVFGQLISNMATALIVIPIAIAAATELGVDVRPVLMSVTIAASAAYLTPVATPVNLMVMGPAGYRFGDYWKLGLPLLAVTFLVAVFLVPVIWPF